MQRLAVGLPEPLPRGAAPGPAQAPSLRRRRPPRGRDGGHVALPDRDRQCAREMHNDANEKQ